MNVNHILLWALWAIAVGYAQVKFAPKITETVSGVTGSLPENVRSNMFTTYLVGGAVTLIMLWGLRFVLRAAKIKAPVA